MEEKTEEKTEEILRTKDGHPYQIVEKSEGVQLKIRYHHNPARLIEDDESYEEYKIRRQAMKYEDRQRKKGIMYWHGSWGSKTMSKMDTVMNYMEMSNNDKDKFMKAIENKDKEAETALQIIRNNRKNEQ
jgi:hypothetical protein|tara:strand:+ start:259 stop:648 length:390 start_codon:yes stop_codon:yes gene_type:complete